MLKIDRQAFLALAMGMNLGACYVSSPPPQQPRQTTMPGPANEMAPTVEGGSMAPADECVNWTPTGECNRWEPRNEGGMMAPAQECIAWTPTGECNRWEPRKEY